MRILLLCFCLVMELQASAQSFTVSKQKGVDLRQYKTFKIEKGELATGGVREIDADAFFAEFKSFVTREMESRGYVYSESSEDVSISYLVELKTEFESENLGPLGGTPVDNPALVDQPSHWSREFTRGTLIINMTDLKTKGTVWNASGTMDATKAKGAKLLDRCVKRAFKKYPTTKG